MSEQEPMMPFDSINLNTPFCKNIHPSFCQAVFQAKHMIYNDIIYSKNPDTAEAQDIKLINTYEQILKQIHPLFMSAFAGIATQIPDIKGIANTTLLAIKQLYHQCIQETQNNNSQSLVLYKDLIHNMFHVYLYDMGSE